MPENKQNYLLNYNSFKANDYMRESVRKSQSALGQNDNNVYEKPITPNRKVNRTSVNWSQRKKEKFVNVSDPRSFLNIQKTAPRTIHGKKYSNGTYYDTGRTVQSQQKVPKRMSSGRRGSN